MNDQIAQRKSTRNERSFFLHPVSGTNEIIITSSFNHPDRPGLNFYNVLSRTLENEDGISNLKYEKLSDLSTANDQQKFILEAQGNGIFQIRQGEFYIYDTAEEQKLVALKDNEKSEIDRNRLNWKITCTDLSEMAHRPVDSTKVISSISPESCSSSEISIKMPINNGGKYYLRIKDTSTGYLEEKLNVSYGMKVTGVSPAEIGSLGGIPITISGGGFTEDTTVSIQLPSRRRSVETIECSFISVSRKNFQKNGLIFHNI